MSALGMPASMNSLYYWHNKLFSTFATALVSSALYRCGCQTTFYLSLGFLAYFIYKIAPKRKPPGHENVKAVVIGGGVSGINASIRLKEMGIEHVVLEKSSRLGGTWYDNTYPGAACDVPSHLYSFSFYPNPWWSQNYSKQVEIRTYLEDVASHYRLYPHFRFNKNVETSTWDEKTKKWTVKCKDGEVFEANFLLSAVGALHVPQTPKFEGHSEFQGESFHSAKWRGDVDITNKRVGVIGTGASAVQIVPNIADVVKDVTVFQRTPCWVPPRFGYVYPTWAKVLFAFVPPARLLHRWFFFWVNEYRFHDYFDVSRGAAMKKVEGVLKAWHKYILGKNPDLLDKLTPKYPVGCKRITPSDTYLRAYNKPNVHLNTDAIERFTPNGILTKAGEEVQLDVVVFATGFNVLGSFAGLHAVGRKGKVLGEVWGDSPAAFKGGVVPDFPNLFFLLGPNTGLGHNSIIYIIECQVNYTMDCIRNVLSAGQSSMNVKQSAMDNYMDMIVNKLKSKVWSAGCASWYQNAKGVVWTLWPNDLTNFWWTTRKCSPTDFDMN